MERLSGDIWAFAQALYARPGFADAALHVQDRHGGDVCLLIAMFWHAARGNCPGPADVATLDLAAAPWREAVIRPLRTARRAMKAVPAAEALRSQVKGMELEAERTLLERLAGVELHGDGTVAIALASYAARLRAPIDALAALMPAPAAPSRG